MLLPLDVVVCPDREHKDGAAVRGPGGTVNPLSLESLNCRSVGSSGLSCCLSLLAARAMFSGFAIAGQGSSSGISSSNTLLTMADAGLNKFSRAICGKKIQYNQLAY